MAIRNLLHKNHEAAFMEFMTKKGYILSPRPKNPFESFRMVNPRLKGKKRTVIVYEKMELKEHFSVQDKDMYFVYEFLKGLKGKENATM
jgi:predicted nucleic acid-binding OB-fold protein